MSGRQKVVVAMSGGVDSSVAACLLCEQGYEVIGLFMRLGSEAFADPDSGDRRQGCCSAADAADARFVAGRLGIPFYAVNFRKEFERIIDYFADEYVRGRTPNPCVVCNDDLKFGRLLDYADMTGTRFVATGHYARVAARSDGPALLRPADLQKDQTYFLFGLRRAVLPRVLFPLAQMTKAQVRDYARRQGLPNWDKPDSVEICFVPGGDYARVVRQRRPEAFRRGEVLDETGARIGEHDGVAGYTIGQRRGLGIALGAPAYVTHIDARANTVTLGPRQVLAKRGLVAERVNWLTSPPREPFRALARVRYTQNLAPCAVRPHDGGTVEVRFDEPALAITPGQAVVFYDGDRVLGGGWIQCACDVE